MGRVLWRQAFHVNIPLRCRLVRFHAELHALIRLQYLDDLQDVVRTGIAARPRASQGQVHTVGHSLKLPHVRADRVQQEPIRSWGLTNPYAAFLVTTL